VLDPATQQQIDQQTAQEYQQYFGRTPPQPGGAPPGGMPQQGGR
jgi:hypothetical protein